MLMFVQCWIPSTTDFFFCRKAQEIIFLSKKSSIFSFLQAEKWQARKLRGFSVLLKNPSHCTNMSKIEVKVAQSIFHKKGKQFPCGNDLVLFYVNIFLQLSLSVEKHFQQFLQKVESDPRCRNSFSANTFHHRNILLNIRN